ncbi:polo-like kinase 3 [Mortierella sp. NVP41]|nr:polo-like kinase 3 [Mortierella sp. NVP41]
MPQPPIDNAVVGASLPHSLPIEELLAPLPFVPDVYQPASGFHLFFDQDTGKLYVESRDEELGRGGYGFVYEVKDAEENRYALKMPKPTTLAKAIDREIAMLRRIKETHENVVKFPGTVNDLEGKGLLFELCLPRDFRSLLKTRKALTVEEVKYFGKQLVAGLAHIHGQGLIHCDFKPPNKLVGPGMQLKVSDLGLAEDIAEAAMYPRGDKTGTPGFIAPEAVYEQQHIPAMDVYSLGCTFFAMLTGEVPMWTNWYAAVPLPKIFFDGLLVPEDAQDMLRCTLKCDVHDRTSLDKLARHRFFKRGFWPRSLPESIFDTAPNFDTPDEPHKRHIEEAPSEGSEDARKKRRQEKGKEVVRTLEGVDLLDEYYQEMKEIKAEEKKTLLEFEVAKLKWEETQARLKEKGEKIKAKYGLEFDLQGSSSDDV